MKKNSFKKLKNIELFKSLTEFEQREVLIANRIYTLERDENQDYSIINPTLVESVKTDNNVLLGEFFKHNDKNYFVNPRVYELIFEDLEWYIYIHEEKASWLIEIQIQHIISLIPKKNEAIEILLTKRNEFVNRYFMLMEEFPTFIDGLKQPENYGFENADQLVLASIKEDYQTISDFILKTPLDFNRLTNIWTEVRTLDLKIKAINEKIDELNNFTQNRKDNQIKIFKDDGEEIFNFLVSETVEEKNTAFFSYLYLFLRSINKTISKGYQNKAYREYVLSTSSIVNSSYKSIQKTSEKDNSKQYNVVKQFKINLKKYYSLNEE